MPADTNAYGDIFGGWLLGMMDVAAGSVAARRSAGRAATIAVEAMKFHRPVAVGDEVSVYAEVESVGRTSMTIAVEAWRRPRQEAQRERVTEARFVFVAVGEDRRPRPIDPSANEPPSESPAS